MEGIAEQLRSRLEAEPSIQLAVLFGSAARGQLTSASDLDLAIAWRERRPVHLSRLLAELERLGARSLDLIELDGAPPQLRFEIARDGVVLVEATAGTWSHFRARAMLDWWDFQPIARGIHRAAIARLGKHDGSR